MIFIKSYVFSTLFTMSPAMPDPKESTTAEEMQCDICKRPLEADDLAWHLSQLICRDCLAELDDSCGCSDK